MALMIAANQAAPVDPVVRQLIDFRIKMILDDEDEFVYDDKERVKERIEAINEREDEALEHAPITNVADSINHLRDMIREGYSDSEILERHPELRGTLGA